jgi:hypothetical protein
MTFEEFQATRQWSDDLGRDIPDECFADPAHPDRKEQGNLYLSCLYIDAVQEWWPQEARNAGKWHLLLGRDEWITDDLESLERKLYEWAIDEGYDKDARTDTDED